MGLNGSQITADEMPMSNFVASTAYIFFLHQNASLMPVLYIMLHFSFQTPFFTVLFFKWGNFKNLVWVFSHITRYACTSSEVLSRENNADNTGNSYRNCNILYVDHAYSTFVLCACRRAYKAYLVVSGCIKLDKSHVWNQITITMTMWNSHCLLC